MMSGVSAAGAQFPRKLVMPHHEFFAKMGPAIVEPFVDNALLALLAHVTPNLTAVGFEVAEGAPAVKRLMGAGLVIREACSLFNDMSLPNTAPTLSVTVRVIARSDKHDDPTASDLVLDVVARRLALPGDSASRRPFLLVTLADVRVDWGNLIDRSFSNSLLEALDFLRIRGEADDSVAAGARDFATQLVDKLAP